jgi:hypothetical protein
MIMLLGLLAVSCKKDDGDQEPTKKTMDGFPFIGEGHESIYIMDLFGNLDTSTTMKSYPINDVEWMVVAGNALGSDTTVVFKEGDFMMSYDLGADPSTAIKLLKANAMVGDNWQADTITNVITQTDVSLDVAAGSFQCVELAQITPSNDTSLVYYNVNDGIIKQSFDAVVIVVDLELYSKNF